MQDYSNTKMQFRRGTAAEWSAIDPILGEGEPGYDTTNDILKIGNGVDVWADLDGMSSGSVQTVEADTLEIAVGTYNNYLPSVNADTIRVTNTGAVFITGISTSYGRSEFTLVNDGPYNMYLDHQSLSSDANNRLYYPSGSRLFVYNGDSVRFIYDTSINRWLITGSGQATKVVSLTQEEYDALSLYDANTLYIVT
jgi:hypothetical protein